jgi:pyruvate, orthophosphate dikinase
MEEALPQAYAELLKVRETLEQHYRDMQDIEFTVQSNTLYMLQTRNGKRTATAGLRMAVEMAQAGLIDKAEAVRRINPASLDQLLHPMLDPDAKRTLLGRGLPASPGAACGIDRLLPGGRARLSFLQPLPRAGRASGRRAGGACWATELTNTCN